MASRIHAHFVDTAIMRAPEVADDYLVALARLGIHRRRGAVEHRPGHTHWYPRVSVPPTRNALPRAPHYVTVT